MSGTTKEIKLARAANRLSSKPSYIAHLSQRYTLNYEAVLDEVIERGFLNVSKPMLRMIIEHTLDTMIENTLKDGNSRRLGDYFVLQMEVCGRFDSPDDQFDANRHRLALTLRPLKALKRKPGRDDVKVYNRNAGPKVSIERICSASTPGNDTLVFGDDIVIEGENLFYLDEPTEVQDSLTVGYYAQHLRKPLICSVDVGAGMVSEDGRRMVIPWESVVGQSIDLNWNLADPGKNPPKSIMVALRSRGGVSTAKLQLHRARAFFDTWLKKYPKSTFDGVSWGGL